MDPRLSGSPHMTNHRGMPMNGNGAHLEFNGSGHPGMNGNGLLEPNRSLLSGMNGHHPVTDGHPFMNGHPLNGNGYLPMSGHHPFMSGDGMMPMSGPQAFAPGAPFQVPTNGHFNGQVPMNGHFNGYGPMNGNYNGHPLMNAQPPLNGHGHVTNNPVSMNCQVPHVNEAAAPAPSLSSPIRTTSRPASATQPEPAAALKPCTFETDEGPCRVCKVRAGADARLSSYIKQCKDVLSKEIAAGNIPDKDYKPRVEQLRPIISLCSRNVSLRNRVLNAYHERRCDATLAEFYVRQHLEVALRIERGKLWYVKTGDMEKARKDFVKLPPPMGDTFEKHKANAELLKDKVTVENGEVKKLNGAGEQNGKKRRSSSSSSGRRKNPALPGYAKKSPEEEEEEFQRLKDASNNGGKGARRKSNSPIKNGNDKITKPARNNNRNSTNGLDRFQAELLAAAAETPTTLSAPAPVSPPRRNTGPSSTAVQAPTSPPPVFPTPMPKKTETKAPRKKPATAAATAPRLYLPTLPPPPSPPRPEEPMLTLEDGSTIPLRLLHTLSTEQLQELVEIEKAEDVPRQYKYLIEGGKLPEYQALMRSDGGSVVRNLSQAAHLDDGEKGGGGGVLRSEDGRVMWEI